MDFDLAAPITRTVAAALAIGDCGYPHKGALGEAYAAFAADRLGWDVDPGRVYPIPDVMTGARRGGRGHHPAGLGDRRQPAGLPAVPVPVRLLRTADHRCAAGQGRGGQVRPGPGGDRGGAEPAGRGRLPAVQPAQPDRQRVVGRGSWRWSPTCASATAPPCWWTRSTPRWCCRAPASCRSARCGHEMTGHGVRLHVRVEGVEHPRPQVRRRGGWHRSRGRRCWSSARRRCRRAPRRARVGGRLHRRAAVAGRGPAPAGPEPGAAGLTCCTSTC